MKKNKTVGFFGGKFLPFHLGHLYAIKRASKMVDELYIVLSSSKNRDEQLCKRDGIKLMPAQIRLSWLGEAIADFKNVKLVHIEDDQFDENYNWAAGAKEIKKAIGQPINIIFSSEPSYEGHFKKNYPDAKHIILDSKRRAVNISATRLRKNLYENWHMLPSYVKKHFVKKVVIVGTESCGKSTLVKKLAKFYNTNFIEETGRTYCDKYSNNLTKEMFDSIAMEHFLKIEKQLENSNEVLFIDTEAVVTQFYLNKYFNGAKSKLIEEIAKIQKFDLVIYLEPDVKWVDDGLRFDKEDKMREQNNKVMKNMFRDLKIKFISVDGNYSERFDKAKKLVDELLK